MIDINVALSIECLTSTNREKNRVANGAGGHDLKDKRRGKYKGDKMSRRFAPAVMQTLDKDHNF
jgi:hypothetical protein